MIAGQFHIAQINVAEGAARLDHLRTHGPGAYAFTFKQRFPPTTG